MRPFEPHPGTAAHHPCPQGCATGLNQGPRSRLSPDTRNGAHPQKERQKEGRKASAGGLHGEADRAQRITLHQTGTVTMAARVLRRTTVEARGTASRSASASRRTERAVGAAP